MATRPSSAIQHDFLKKNGSTVLRPIRQTVSFLEVNPESKTTPCDCPNHFRPKLTDIPVVSSDNYGAVFSPNLGQDRCPVHHRLQEMTIPTVTGTASCWFCFCSSQKLLLSMSSSDFSRRKKWKLSIFLGLIRKPDAIFASDDLDSYPRSKIAQNWEFQVPDEPNNGYDGSTYRNYYPQLATFKQPWRDCPLLLIFSCGRSKGKEVATTDYSYQSPYCSVYRCTKTQNEFVWVFKIVNFPDSAGCG